MDCDLWNFGLVYLYSYFRCRVHFPYMQALTHEPAGQAYPPPYAHSLVYFFPVLLQVDDLVDLEYLNLSLRPLFPVRSSSGL